MKILLLNGPNLNLLGKREPHIYGSQTLNDILTKLKKTAGELDLDIEHFQSNSEAALIDKIHTFYESDSNKFDGIIINPAAFTHTSVALRDAIAATAVPFIEVHLSNVHARETFRHHSYFSDIALAVIMGAGAQGYEFALQAMHKHLSS